MDEISSLEQAISALEAQRLLLGDSVVETALGPLREKLASLRAPAEEPHPETSQRRRIVTILFADVSGFTAMSESMDMEDVRDTMNSLWHQLDALIVARNGKIDKHMGDGVMAIWGADEAREDDPEQALRAAWAMQEALANFRRESGNERINMRIGIHTGSVLLGAIGATAEMSAIGDAVTLAGRLEQAAPVGRILISHDTYRHVRGVFDVETHQSLPSRQKNESIQTYLVRSPKPRVFRMASRGIEGVETRMVGRDEPLAQLQAAFRTITQENRLQIVTIISDAGLGKSRLLYEFQAWAELQPTPWWVFHGRAVAAAANAPYALLRDIFSYRFEIDDSEPLASAREKMERGMAQFMRGDLYAFEKAHFLGHLIGLDFSASPYLRGILGDPRQIASQSLHYLVQFFQRAAAQDAVLLMLDDVHWADAASLDALIHLLNNLPPETRMLVIIPARPSVFERFPDWESRLPPHARIELLPLSKDQSRDLVAEILKKAPNLPTVLLELVVGGAEGNPYYLEEFIKMLIDSRVIEPGEEEWKIYPERLASVRVPPTLNEVLQARLDSLTPRELNLLQRASVVGRIFWDATARALAPDTAEDVDEILANLRRKELIFERRPSAFAGTREYTFKHSILHDVTYQTLLKRQRTAYHARVADWLEQNSGERRNEYLSLIAEHYAKASQMERSAEILLEAGNKAFGLSALAEAREFFEQALFLLAENPASLAAEQVFRIEFSLADVCLQIGDYPAAQMHAEAALTLGHSTDTDRMIADAQAQLGQVATAQGDYVRAKSFLVGALYLAREQGQPGRLSLGRILGALASVEWRLGNLDMARDYARESYEVALEMRDVPTVISGLNRLGVIMGALGFPEEEERMYQQALEQATVSGNRERISMVLNNLGAWAGENHQWGNALNYYEQALRVARETGARQSTALYLINLGMATIRLKKLDSARQYLLEGTRLALELGAVPVLLAGVIYFGLLAQVEGDLQRALTLFALVLRHPSADSENEREINGMLAEWGVLPAQLEQAPASDWDTEIQKLTGTHDTTS